MHTLLMWLCLLIGILSAVYGAGLAIAALHPRVGGAPFVYNSAGSAVSLTLAAWMGTLVAHSGILT